MSTRSLLVYAPWVPCQLEALMPQHVLAALAGALVADGHETEILDYGTLRGLRTLARPGVRAAGTQMADSGVTPQKHNWRSWWLDRQIRSLNAVLAEAVSAHHMAVALQIADRGALDFMVYLLNTRGDVAAAASIAGTVRQWCPNLPQLVVGPFAERHAGLLLSERGEFDGALTGDIELGIREWAPVSGRRHAWREASSLVYREDGGIVRTPVRRVPSLEALPAPCYDRPVYPALAGGEKLHLYTVEQSRGDSSPGCGKGASRFGPVRVRGSKDTLASLQRLMRLHGAMAFHIAGSGTPSAQCDCLAYDLVAFGKPVRYSRSTGIRHIDPATTRALYSSGCRAAEVRADTGSQRLLDDFYGSGFGVTRMEEALRACRRAGLYTALRLTYPCPQDDYHTHAETLRLLQRCKPDSVAVAPAEPEEGSMWLQRAPSFGFRADWSRYGKWAGARDLRPAWAPPAVLFLPYRMAGWSTQGIARGYSGFCEDVAAMGIAHDVGARAALLAAMTRGVEQDRYLARIYRALYTFDMRALEELMDCFNRRALAPVNTVRFHPYTPVLAAVGN